MSVTKENQLLKMVIETQASRIKEQEETIKELRLMVDELRTWKKLWKNSNVRCLG